MYWLDKEAAQGGAQRIPESTLHLVDLLGGWHGALIAQQQFRHKTVKRSFQFAFWCSVLANVAIMAWLVRSGVARPLPERSEERRGGKGGVSTGRSRLWPENEK